MSNERFKITKWEIPDGEPIVIDEAPTFVSDSLCLDCNHLRFFMHVYDVYQANDSDEPDLMVWKCKEENCDCISVTAIIPETT